MKGCEYQQIARHVENDCQQKEDEHDRFDENIAKKNLSIQTEFVVDYNWNY